MRGESSDSHPVGELRQEHESGGQKVGGRRERFPPSVRGTLGWDGAPCKCMRGVFTQRQTGERFPLQGRKTGNSASSCWTGTGDGKKTLTSDRSERKGEKKKELIGVSREISCTTALDISWAKERSSL